MHAKTNTIYCSIWSNKGQGINNYLSFIWFLNKMYTFTHYDNNIFQLFTKFFFTYSLNTNFLLLTVVYCLYIRISRHSLVRCELIRWGSWCLLPPYFILSAHRAVSQLTYERERNKVFHYIPLYFSRYLRTWQIATRCINCLDSWH